MAIKVTDLLASAVSASASEFAIVKRGRKAADYWPILRKIASDGFLILPAGVWKDKGASVQKFAKSAGHPVTGLTSVNGDKVRLTLKNPESVKTIKAMIDAEKKATDESADDGADDGAE